MRVIKGFNYLALVLFLVSLVYAAAVGGSEGEAAYYIKEDISYFFNVTVNNTDLGDQLANITMVQIVFNSNFTLTPGTNASNAEGVFENHSDVFLVLNWSNITGVLINASNISRSFWFNVTSTEPGSFNFSVDVTNGTTGAFNLYRTNITLIVNDTTVPFEVNVSEPANLTTYTAITNNINFTCNVSDNYRLGYVWVEIYNETGTYQMNETDTYDIKFNASRFTNNISLDGVYTWNCYANDTYANINASVYNRTLIVDTTVPDFLNLLTPLNGTTNTNGTIVEFSCNVSDNVRLDGFKLEIFNFTGVINKTNMTAINTNTNFSENNFTQILSDGEYLWNCYGNDTGNWINASPYNYSVIVDTTVPHLVTVIGPANLTTYTAINNNINFSCNVSDNVKLNTQWINIYNSSGDVYITNYTNVTGINNYSNFTMNISVDGVYTWNCYGNDTGNWVNASSNNQTVIVDTTFPSEVDSISPSNGTYNNGTGIFSCNATDSVRLGVMKLEIFNATALYKTNFSEMKDTTYDTVNFSMYIPIDGNYTWSCYANDTANNINTSKTFNQTFIVDSTDPSVSMDCTPENVISGETETCACSASDNIDSTLTFEYTLNPSTDSTGTYTEICTVTDDAGNQASASDTYTVEASGSSSSSSGGGSTTTWKKTITVEKSDLSSGYKKELGAKERLRVYLGEEYHYIAVMKVNTDNVEIQVASNPQNAVMKVGSQMNFEVTGDNYYDLIVRVNSISGTKADVTVRSIHEIMTTEQEEESDAAKAGEVIGDVPADDVPPTDDVKSLAWLWIVIGVIVVVVVVWFLMRGRGGGVVKRR